jgi:hypothetical protein
VNVSWTASDSSGSSPLVGYTVDAYTADGKLVSQTPVSPGSTSATIGGLPGSAGVPPNTVFYFYYFTVTATNFDHWSSVSIPSSSVEPLG